MSKFFHIYNRGVDRRTLFNNSVDFKRFLKQIDIFCIHIDNPSTELVRVHAYCLMDNHFHLLIEECIENGVAMFMQRLGIGYTAYFNGLYGREGHLFSSKYKRKVVVEEAYLAYLPVYIHTNPLDILCPGWQRRNVSVKFLVDLLKEYSWSSLGNWIVSDPDYLHDAIFGSVKDHLSLLRDYIHAKKIWPHQPLLYLEP